MFYFLVKTISRIIFTLFFRAKIIGADKLPPSGAVILAANHMSNADPPFLGSFLCREVCYMAKIELFRNPVFGAAIRACHSFPVKRGTADRKAIKHALELLADGKCLGLFPEGTRSKTGEMQEAELGVGLFAAKSKAPVVPAAIIGTDKIFSSACRFPKLKLVLGEPMYYEGNPKDKTAMAEFSQAVAAHIAKLKAEHENDD